MSNPNYDNRYTKPADVDAKIATQAVADAGQYSLQGINYVYAVGDSITAQGVGSLTTGQPSGLVVAPFAFDASSPMANATTQGNGNWIFAGQSALVGYTAAQCRATLLPNLFTVAPKGSTIIVAIGTNGMIISDIISCFDYVRNNGYKLVAATMPPYGSTSDGSWNAELTTVLTVNEKIREYAMNHNVPLIDRYRALADAQTGAYASGNGSGDNIHPTTGGYQILGAAIATILNGLFPNAINQLSPINALTNVTHHIYKNPLNYTVSGYGFTAAALGSGSITDSIVTGFNGQAKTFTVGNTTIEGWYNGPSGLVLVAGHGYRFGIKAKFSPAGSSPGFVIRFEDTTSASTWLLYWGGSGGMVSTNGIVPLVQEFVMPSGIATTYRIHITVYGTGSVLQVGELTLEDLTVRG